MNIREFYSLAGGNYDEILQSLGKEERVIKFVKMFPSQNQIENIDTALKAQDYQTAFREAHNLKGMSINIGLKNLFKVSSDLTESLRNGPVGDVNGLYELTSIEYKKTCELISQIES